MMSSAHWPLPGNPESPVKAVVEIRIRDDVDVKEAVAQIAQRIVGVLRKRKDVVAGIQG